MLALEVMQVPVNITAMGLHAVGLTLIPKVSFLTSVYRNHVLKYIAYVISAIS